MRITNSMMVNTLMTNLTRNMNRMSVYQDQLATGKRVIRASDDPVGTSKILKFKSDIAALQQYEKNTGDSLSWLEITESSIADTGDVIQRMRELAIQAANGTNELEDTQKIAMEIDQLKEHLISNGNFNYAGRYVFSGYQTDKPLFKADGTYNIDITQTDLDNKPKLQYQVSIEQEMDVTTNGLDVFGYVNIDNVMTQGVPDGVKQGMDATKAVIKGTVDYSANFSALTAADTMTVTVEGVGYTVDGTELKLLSSPIQKDDILSVIGSAVSAGVPLSEKAAVMFDAKGQLTLQSPQVGAASSISIGFAGPNAAIIQSALAFSPLSATGSDATPAVITGTGNLDAATIATDPNAFVNQKLLVTYNGAKAEIMLSATAPTSPADIVADINSQLNGIFGAGMVVASFDAATQKLSISGAPQADGEGSTLEIRTIRASKSQLIQDVDNFVAALNTGDSAAMLAFIGKVDAHQNQILSVRADIGARSNRMELVANRIASNTITFTTMLSDAQDAEMAGVIMFLKNAENVYKAALSTGSKVIQPSLIDFLR